MHKNIKKIIVTRQQIQERAAELAQEIEQYYEGQRPPILIALLKGSVPFLAELITHINLDIEYDFMDVSSYEGTESIGDVRIIKDLDKSIKGENILLVEDIVDTGRTVHEVTKLLANKGAADVKTCTLLDKPSRRIVEVPVDFVGFEIENEFVVGFGLDFDEKYRQLPYVGVLKDEMYQ